MYKKLFQVMGDLKNFINLTHIRLKYPNIKFKGRNTIGNNCKFFCGKESEIIIENVDIKDGVTIIADHGGKISIRNSYVGYCSVIVARKSIQIKENCQIAEMVVIRDQNHKYGEKNLTIAEQGFNSSPIIINPNVWIAAKSTILMGSIIGENAVIGAHSIVSGNIEPNSVYVGAIAKKIKSF